MVCAPDELSRAVRRATGSFMVGPRLSGGADVVIDAFIASLRTDSGMPPILGN